MRGPFTTTQPGLNATQPHTTMGVDPIAYLSSAALVGCDLCAQVVVLLPYGHILRIILYG